MMALMVFSNPKDAQWFCFRRKGHDGDHGDIFTSWTDGVVPEKEQCKVLFKKPEPPPPDIPPHDAELRRLAEAATSGPWELCADHSLEPPDPVWHVAKYEGDPPLHDIPASHADNAYIAAVSPDVVLALLDRIEELEARVVEPPTNLVIGDEDDEAYRSFPREFGEILDLIEELYQFLRPYSSEEQPGEVEASRRARALLARYRGEIGVVAPSEGSE